MLLRIACIFLICLSAVRVCSLRAQSPSLASYQIREDIALLKKELDKRHPNLYLYSDPGQHRAFWQKVEADIPEGAIPTEVFRILSPLLSLIKDGHTLLLPPRQSIQASNRDSLFFPLDLYWDGSWVVWHYY